MDSLLSKTSQSTDPWFHADGARGWADLKKNSLSSAPSTWNFNKINLDTPSNPVPWTYDNSLLKKKDLKPFDFAKDDPQELIEKMKKVLIETDGIGLSANQIGIDARVFMLGSKRHGIQYVAYFNPVITFYSKDTDTLREGCLSFPGLYVMIRRSKVIRLRHQNKKGEQKVDKFEAIGARIVQHEVDHLNGITFLERASKYALERAVKHQKQGKFG